MGAIGSILGIGMTGMTGMTGATAANAANPAKSAADAAANATATATGVAPVSGKGNDFGNVVASALDGLQGVQSNADGLAVKAATGDLNYVHDYMIAASEASLATEFAVALRDRAVEAFNQIMGMQI